MRPPVRRAPGFPVPRDGRTGGDQDPVATDVADTGTDTGTGTGTDTVRSSVADDAGDSRAAADAAVRRLARMDPDDPGRADLRSEVVQAHLGLVHHLARRYEGRGEPLDDLVQVGTIGLLKAVDRYDPQRGASLATFAVPTILGEIRRHFRDRGWAVRVPRRLQELVRTLTEAREALTHELGRAPTVAELAERADLDPDTVLEGLESAGAYSTVPIDTGTDADADWPGVEDEDLAGVENREALRPLLARLPARERRIIALRFVRGMSQSQIAQEVGLSQMHVSRLLARSLASLREGLTDEG
ncbi:SigB/SigF/SigG family RNA polymerase sigma factor [Thalassiella azotivora]